MKLSINNEHDITSFQCEKCGRYQGSHVDDTDINVGSEHKCIHCGHVNVVTDIEYYSDEDEFVDELEVEYGFLPDVV